jgi:actin-related protein 8
MQDLRVILSQALAKFVKLEAQNYKHFSVLLLVPGTLPKHHLRYLVELVVAMGFKQVMPLLESVAASYAMAAQTACVVDLGHTQTTVSCVDDGQVQP